MAKTFKLLVSLPVTVVIDTDSEKEMEKVFNMARDNLKDPEKRAQILATGQGAQVQIVESCKDFEDFLLRCAKLEVRGTIKDAMHQPRAGMRAGAAKVEVVK